MIARMTSKDNVFLREWNIRDGYSQVYRNPHWVGPHQTGTGQRKCRGVSAPLVPLRHP